MFVDDTGNLDRPTSGTKECRFGAVFGVIMASDYAQNTFDPAFYAMCNRHFGLKSDGSRILLHRRQMVRPSEKGPYACLLDDKKRAEFDENCMKMFENTAYTAIVAAVDKVGFYNKYPEWNGDFYEIVVESITERYFYFLRNAGATGDVIIEAKAKDRDRAIKDAYSRHYNDGFDYIKASNVQRQFSSKEINIIDKKVAIPGLQLADLLAAPALAKCLEINFSPKHAPTGMPAAAAEILLRDKFYRDQSGKISGYGMVWRPPQT